MKITIEIPEHIYEHAMEGSEDSRDETAAIKAIANATAAENTKSYPEDVLYKIRSDVAHLHDWAFSRDAIIKIIDEYIKGE